jgi:ribosomal-protein-alanine N-acetyltransferase
VLEEMHVMNIATHPLHRRKGVAKRLLCHALHHAVGMGVQKAVLEVRPSNLPAVALYSSMGFKIVGRRLRYYQDTGEDAVVMSLDVRGKT